MEGHKAIRLKDSESVLEPQQNYFQTTNPNPQKPVKAHKNYVPKNKIRRNENFIPFINTERILLPSNFCFS